MQRGPHRAKIGRFDTTYRIGASTCAMATLVVQICIGNHRAADPRRDMERNEMLPGHQFLFHFRLPNTSVVVVTNLNDNECHTIRMTQSPFE